MTHINAYLTFNGNCREAMKFYQHCFGGKLNLQTVEEAPMSCEMPNLMKKSILHASLVRENFVLMASDMIGPWGYQKGNSIALAIQTHSKDEILNLFAELSESVKSDVIIKENDFKKPIELTDRFGINWVFILSHYTDQNIP